MNHPSFEVFAGASVLVTGGAGFIGRALCARLRELDATVAITDLTAKEAGSSVPYVGVASPGRIETAFAMTEPDFVFHLAAQSEVGRGHREPHHTLVTNVLGTINVVEACRLRGEKLRAAVFASSDKAYGTVPREQLPYREADDLAVDGDLYAASKRAGDEIVSDYVRLYGVPARILRCANTYGPGQTNYTTLVAAVVRALLAGKRPSMFSPNTEREWLYLTDAVDAYLLVAAAVATGNEGGTGRAPENRPLRGRWAYNVGSGEVASVEQVTKTLCRLADVDEERIMLEPQGREARPIPYQSLDSSRFRNLFPLWKPTPLVEGLAKTLASYRATYRPE